MSDPEADLSHPLLFRRCAVCDTEPPPCPACGPNEVCSLIGGDCRTCPETRCEKVGDDSNQKSGKSSPAGPIAGGVIGGILVVCVMTFLVWRFCIKKRREAYDQEIWRASAYEKNEDDEFQSRKSRASTHSVRSIASTVLTRASNVIQIAYIPGVTNRSDESTPDLIPPVPPVPALSAIGSTSGSPHLAQDEHFFLPSDLRNSTYSDYTVDRTSYARTSMTPSVARGSVPSTAYRGSAVVNTLPAQTAIRGRANPVAVRNGGKNSPPLGSGPNTPPVPKVDKLKQDNIRTNTTSPIVARLGVPKAVTVTKSHGNLAAAAASQKAASPVSSVKSEPKLKTAPDRHVSVAESRHDGHSSTFDDQSSSDEESPADQSLMGHDKLPRFSRLDQRLDSPSSAPDLRLAPSPLIPSSPNPSTRAKKQQHKRSGSLNQMIEDATRIARREPRHGGLGSVGNIRENPRRSPEGPFSDEHAARTP